MQINYSELKVKVREYMGQIKGKFEVVDHLTAYIATAHLVRAISQAYILVSRFLEKAVKYYTQCQLSKSWPQSCWVRRDLAAESYFQAIAKPWKKFEDIVNSLDQTFIKSVKLRIIMGCWLPTRIWWSDEQILISLIRSLSLIKICPWWSEIWGIRSKLLLQLHFQNPKTYKKPQYCSTSK